MDMTEAVEEKKLYKYFAFISYSRADIAWGKKIQRKLERYRLPSRMRKKYPDTPQRAYPIFRDETNLSGFKVWESLKKELDDSKYLIVLCSPRSAASDWVNDEIQYFIDQGKENRILPLIIDGIPYSGDPKTECFPPALRKMKEAPLGINVQSLGWRESYLNMVSTLLQINYDELLLRDKRRRFRNNTVCTLAGIILAGGLFGLLWSTAEHSKYYNAYILQNEVPVGLYELTKEQRASTSECYRITTQWDIFARKNLVNRLETVNAKGVAVAPYWSNTLTDYPVQEYQYDDEGQLISIIQKDATGMEITRKELSANPSTNEIAIDFRSPSNSLNAQSLAADMSATVIGGQGETAKSEITRQRNTYDDNGYLLRSLYQRDNLGTPTCDSNGVYGKAYEYNELDLVFRMWNLDERGNPFNCRYGWAYEEFTYNDSGKLVRTEYFDADGNKARGKEGYCAAKATYDPNGNIIQWETLDIDGQRICTAKGYAVLKASYNEEGLLDSEAHFDAEENPVYNAQSFHEARYDHDAYGRICGYRLYDISGEPVYSPTFCFATQQVTLDKDGRVLEVFNFDTQENPAFDIIGGNCGWRQTYDENGYLREVFALNEMREPGASKHGHAIIYTERDGDGRVLREEARDADGALVRTSYNYAIAVYGYDTFGNQDRISFFDEEEQPCCNADGYASVEKTYKNGNLTGVKYFAPDGTPTSNTHYYHECRMEYDGKGNCLRWSYFDTEGNSVNLKEGFAAEKQIYDSYGNVTEKYYFDAAGNPTCEREFGVYGIRWFYDKQGHECGTVYLDAQGNPMTNKYGYAMEEYTLDAVGHILRNAYFDENGDPVRCNQNYASIEYDYDNVGNATEIRFFDEKGNPCSSAEGCSSLKRVYENGKLISGKHFDTDGNPMLNADYYHEARMEYDSKGNNIRWSYYDTEGKLINIEGGYAVIEQKYDIYGNATETSYYTANGEPAILLDVYKYEQEYNTQGNLIREVLHSVHPDNLDFAIAEREYDALGNLVESRYFDETGEPIGPCSVAKREYDARGNLIRVDYFRNNDILGVQEYVYDEFGNEILDRFTLAAGSDLASQPRQTRMTYDAFGNCIRTEHLDEEGNPAVQRGGYTSVVKGYSPTGEVLWCEYYDEAGKPVLNGGETFRYEYDYDAQGNWTEVRKYDAEGKLHTEASGIAAIERYEHDVRGIRTYEGRFNEHGEPFGTEEDPYSAIYYTLDSAGFIDKEAYYDKNGDLLAEYSNYAYAGEVYEGKSAFAAGIAPGQFIIQLGNWNYFEEHSFSTASELRAEVSRTVYTEKEVVMCERTGDTFIFRRYDMPEGEMGIRVMGDMGNARVLEQMEEAYYAWLSENPPVTAKAG